MLTFVSFVAVLAAVAVFAWLWMRFSWAAVAWLTRAAVRFGLYDPGPTGERDATGRRRDTSVHAFTAALRAVSELVPGKPVNNPLVIVVPLLVVGIPAFLLSVVVIVILPFRTAATVADLGPSSLSLVLGVAGFVGYYAAFLVAVDIWRRVAGVHRTNAAFGA